MTREYSYVRAVRARCLTCGASWEGPNAQGVAVRHHDAHGHVVVVHTEMEITYGSREQVTVAQTAQPTLGLED